MKLTLKMLGSFARSRPEQLKKHQMEPMTSMMLAVTCWGRATLGALEVLAQFIV